ncbi:MAG: Ankyrin-2 [Trichoglossum hirsutum]|nr:MAG: Ankyrin-2 [Trichoglossum hirsutum]
MAPDSNDRKAFIQAAKAGDISTLESLLDSGIDVNYKAIWPNGGDKDWNGAPALVLASMYGHLSAIRLLLERGADVDNKNEFPLCCMSALLAASTSGHVEIVKFLVGRGAKFERRVFQGTTNPLVACAEVESSRFSEAHMEIIKLLLDSNCDIDGQNEDGRTALSYAVERGNMDLFKLLLDKGANVNVRAHSDQRKESVLDEAAYFGRLDMVRLLLDKGAEIRHEMRGCTALHRATVLGKLEVMTLLLDRGCRVEAAETGRTTAMHEAAASGASDAIKLLIYAGFNIEARSSKGGLTPLLEAAHWCRKSAVEALLDAGANVNAQDDNGETALHHSTFLINNGLGMAQEPISYPRVGLIRLLVSRGADFTIPDHAGMSVLQKAVQPLEPPSPRVKRTISGAQKACPQGDIEAIKLLLSLGADVNAPDVDGETALHRAAHEWNIDMIQILLDAGANLEARKRDGSTPLFEAVLLTTNNSAQRPHRRSLWWPALLAVEVLLGAGADVNARKEGGETVLHQLAEGLSGESCEEDHGAVSLLLGRGVDLAAVNANGETAAQVAERLGKSDLAELLSLWR